MVGAPPAAQPLDVRRVCPCRSMSGNAGKTFSGMAGRDGGESVMAGRVRVRRMDRREFLALAGASAGAAALAGSLPGVRPQPALAAGPAGPAGPQGLPPGIDPGTPVYSGS